jgi:hypothetical protein
MKLFNPNLFMWLMLFLAFTCLFIIVALIIILKKTPAPAEKSPSKFFAWVSIQIEWAKGFQSEPDTGKASNKRLISTAVVATFIISYLKIAIGSKELLDIPLTWAAVIGAILGLNIANYYVQNKINNSNQQGKQ